MGAVARRRATRGLAFARADGAMAVRRARSQDQGRTGCVGFRLATNSQGMEVKSFTVKTLSRDAWHASVVAKLAPDNWVRQSDRENEIRYDLVWERGRWAIDDVHYVIEPNPWSLRSLLSQYLAR